jgi:hypothetical protein
LESPKTEDEKAEYASYGHSHMCARQWLSQEDSMDKMHEAYHRVQQIDG